MHLNKLNFIYFIKCSIRRHLFIIRPSAGSERRYQPLSINHQAALVAPLVSLWFLVQPNRVTALLPSLEMDELMNVFRWSL